MWEDEVRPIFIHYLKELNLESIFKPENTERENELEQEISDLIIQKTTLSKKKDNFVTAIGDADDADLIPELTKQLRKTKEKMMFCRKV